MEELETDMRPPDPEKAQLPAWNDGVNSRFALRMSQLEDPQCRAIANQRGRALDPAAAKNQRGTTAVMKPLEIDEYRLAPQDHVIEKRAHLSEAALRVPVVPDAVVPGVLPPIKCGRWMFDLAPQTLWNPRRIPAPDGVLEKHGLGV